MTLTLELNAEELQDLINIETGLFSPLKGFMTSSDYNSVLKNMQLAAGTVWTIPITLDTTPDIYSKALKQDKLHLTFNHREIGFLEIADCYKIDSRKNAIGIFNTDDIDHPGVKKEMARSEYRIGGKTTITDESFLKDALMPSCIKEIFSRNNWSTIVGFHTRNPVHRAHEHLQRVGLELCDGLFINPFLGWKKDDDFSDEAIVQAYSVMIECYYPRNRVYFSGLKCAMRYAGPREAVFHAIIRKNMGCTHFIIGRDHAGVGNYYGKYEAQELAKKLADTKGLGIELLFLSEPYYCRKCNGVVSDKHCGHGQNCTAPISGTSIRAMLREGKRPDEIFLRPEVTEALLALKEKMFIR